MTVSKEVISEKPTVTIGVPAYNEESIIRAMVQALLGQRATNVVISKIIVISDGSDDKTVNELDGLSDDRLIVLDYKERKGKSSRMEELFSGLKTDYLVLFDADIKIEDPQCVSKLLSPMVKNEDVKLTSGHPMPVSTHQGFDAITDISAYLQDYVKKNIQGGDNLYACHGRIVALHRDLAKSVFRPFSLVGNDAFLYLQNKSLGYKFSYVEGAIVYYRPPQNIQDFIKQRTRFESTPSEQAKRYGAWVYSCYKIPMLIKVRGIVNVIMSHPISSIEYMVLRIRSRFIKVSNTDTGTWTISESTKRL